MITFDPSNAVLDVQQARSWGGQQWSRTSTLASLLACAANWTYQWPLTILAWSCPTTLTIGASGAVAATVQVLPIVVRF